MLKILENRFFLWLGRKIRAASKNQSENLAVFGMNSRFSGEIVNASKNRDNILIGSETTIDGRLLVYAHGGKIQIGDWCYIGQRTEIWSMASVNIGNRVFISHNVNIIDGTAHSRVPEERHEQFQKTVKGQLLQSWDDLPGVKADPIVIEDDVWINFGVTILKGVRIGVGSVIAANSIVTKDVPPYVLYRNNISPVITPLY